MEALPNDKVFVLIGTGFSKTNPLLDGALFWKLSSAVESLPYTQVVIGSIPIASTN